LIIIDGKYLKGAESGWDSECHEYTIKTEPMMRLSFAILLCCGSFASIPACLGEEQPNIMSAADLAKFPNPAPDARIAYGDLSLQFADLRLPTGPGPHPVMILIHGGCWLSQYDISHIGKLADAFAGNGIATWAVEYRRVGDAGGGWPGTFQDIAHAADHLLNVAQAYSLDTTRVIAAGHSAGGHLALWLAARGQFKDHPAFLSANPVQLKGVLALAPAPDLTLLHETGVCDNVIDKLMGGSPQDFSDRYAIGSATELVPIDLPQLLVIGRYDSNWGEVGRRHFEAAKAANDDIQLIDAAESGHFEMIDPDSSTWPLVLDAAFQLLGMASEEH
jgi:acetyl esterase/lipase